MKKFLNKKIDTTLATDMQPRLVTNPGSKRDIAGRNRERAIAKKYGLDYYSMRRWKLAYFAGSLVAVFVLIELLQDRVPAVVLAFILTIFLIINLFFLPKYVVYRFAKRVKK